MAIPPKVMAKGIHKLLRQHTFLNMVDLEVLCHLKVNTSHNDSCSPANSATKVLAQAVIKRLVIAKVVLGDLVWASRINICLAALVVIIEEAKAVNGANRALEITETLATDTEAIKAKCI